MGRLIVRDLRAALVSSAWLPIVFFLLVVTLVPFAIGPDARTLARVGPGMVWVAAFLSALLPVDRLVAPDLEDGTLDQLAIKGASEEMVASAKIIAHWLAFAPLLLIACFPAAALLALDGEQLRHLLLALAIGTPGLAGLTVAVAALTAGLPRASALAGMLTLPLAVPLLIFGVGASGTDPMGALQLVAAMSLILLAGSPFVAGAAIRASRT
ncbi:heme exporter protein CcmB [Sphingomicrobium clamense]|uniref:Heme exporter protein B n=1 Tax=Sphingomicrobium clamense TaxID=2851013 RepID=A0ABS6V2J4_9SPHN|nr:heme exporter protein CcmB [Sphingomicrobium sp. B8]MBW0143778.1 heme exporter protein CcmB [Sphingomicrobium sp. B8]